MTGRFTSTGLAMLLAACATRDSRPTTVIDTLPSGVITVHNSAPAAWSDSGHAWRFREVARIIGTDGAASALINPRSSALDPLGRIVVVEESPLSIRILSRDGQIIRAFSRGGSGPGELRSPTVGVIGPLIVADDPQLGRLEVFDSTGKLLHEYPAPCCYGYPIAVDGNNHAYIRTGDAADSTLGAMFVRIDVTSGVADTIRLPKLGEPKSWNFSGPQFKVSYGIPYSPHEVVAFTAAGRLLYGWSADYRWAELGFGRDTARLVSKDWTPVERPEPIRRARFDTLAGYASRRFGEAEVNRVFDFSDIPVNAQAMQNLESDPAGRVWVSIFTGDTVYSHYDVFDSTGAWLGRLRAPWHAHEQVTWRTADEVLTRGETEEGYPMLRIWRMQRGQGGPAK